jgi:hypothetical protein
LRQYAHEQDRRGSYFERRAKAGLLQVDMLEQRQQQQYTRVGMAGTEVGLLKGA